MKKLGKNLAKFSLLMYNYINEFYLIYLLYENERRILMENQEVVKINRVKALVKDVKVDKKGITLNFESVQLTGTQISEISALVGNSVFLDIEERLPESRKKTVATEDENVNQLSLFEKEENEEETMSENYVIGVDLS